MIRLSFNPCDMINIHAQFGSTLVGLESFVGLCKCSRNHCTDHRLGSLNRLLASASIIPNLLKKSCDPNEMESYILKAQHGDPSAFRKLVNEHKSEVLCLASRFTKNEAELDELAQDIFIEIHRSLPRFEGKAPFTHWLRKIAVRRCKDHLRKRYRRQSRWVPLFEETTGVAHAKHDPSVDSEIERLNAREFLETAMSKLSPKSYTLIVMYELEGYSINDIAETHSWSTGNTRVKVYRARKELESAIHRLVKNESRCRKT